MGQLAREKQGCINEEQATVRPQHLCATLRFSHVEGGDPARHYLDRGFDADPKGWLQERVNEIRALDVRPHTLILDCLAGHSRDAAGDIWINFGVPTDIMATHVVPAVKTLGPEVNRIIIYTGMYHNWTPPTDDDPLKNLSALSTQADIIVDSGVLMTTAQAHQLDLFCYQATGIEHMAKKDQKWQRHRISLTLAGKRGYNPALPADINGQFDPDENHDGLSPLNQWLAPLSEINSECFVRDDAPNLTPTDSLRRMQRVWALGLSPVQPLFLWTTMGYRLTPTVKGVATT